MTASLLRKFNVYRRNNDGAVIRLGLIQAESQVHADRKAVMLYGSRVWCSEYVD